MGVAPVSHKGSCYGFGIDSALEFEFLRHGDGEVLAVDLHEETGPARDETLLVEWRPRPGQPFHGKVYQNPTGRLRIWTSDAGWYIADVDRGRISMPADTDPIVREARLWTTPMLLTYAQRGALPLHAAAVDIGGQAFVFGGPSRFGKTSLVAAFAAHGHRPLTEDVTCIKLDSKGNHFVVPGPSLLRLRTDVADSLHVPGTRVVARTPERVFLTFEPELRGTSEEVPLGGIVLLRDASERVELTRALGPEVLRDLWALAFRLPIDPDSSRAFSGVVRLADEVAIWDLRRPWELATLLDSVHQIMESLI